MLHRSQRLDDPLSVRLVAFALERAFEFSVGAAFGSRGAPAHERGIGAAFGSGVGPAFECANAA